MPDDHKDDYAAIVAAREDGDYEVLVEINFPESMSMRSRRIIVTGLIDNLLERDDFPYDFAGIDVFQGPFRVDVLEDGGGLVPWGV